MSNFPTMFFGLIATSTFGVMAHTPPLRLAWSLLSLQARAGGAVDEYWANRSISPQSPEPYLHIPVMHISRPAPCCFPFSILPSQILTPDFLAATVGQFATRTNLVTFLSTTSLRSPDRYGLLGAVACWRWSRVRFGKSDRSHVHHQLYVHHE